MTLHPQTKKALSLHPCRMRRECFFLYHASPFDVLTLGSKSPLVRST